MGYSGWFIFGTVALSGALSARTRELGQDEHYRGSLAGVSTLDVYVPEIFPRFILFTQKRLSLDEACLREIYERGIS